MTQPRTRLTTTSRAQLEFTRAMLRKMGAKVTTVRNRMLVVRYRGAIVDVWPTTGTWRVRMAGVCCTPTRRDGIPALVTMLNQPVLAEWMTRTAVERVRGAEVRA